MKVIDALWFTNQRGTCGLVVGEDEKTGARKAFIGVVYGFDEKTDAQDVLETGTQVAPLALKGVVTILEEAKIKEPESTTPTPPKPEKSEKSTKTKKAKGK